MSSRDTVGPLQGTPGSSLTLTLTEETPTGDGLANMFQHRRVVAGRPAAEAPGSADTASSPGCPLRRFHRLSSRSPFLLWASALEVKAAVSLKTQHHPLLRLPCGETVWELRKDSCSVFLPLLV